MATTAADEVHSGPAEIVGVDQSQSSAGGVRNIGAPGINGPADVPTAESGQHGLRPHAEALPSRITFTGADPSSSADDLIGLLRRDRRLELAFLYSEKRAGSGRYPPAEWIAQTARKIEQTLGFGRVALHICGGAVFKLIKGERIDPALGSLWPFQRIQLNGKFGIEEGGHLRRWIGDWHGGHVITQYDSNPDLHEAIRRPSHKVLFDSSGGRGIARKEWPRHLGDWGCGYAGGLGPDNLVAELPRIAAAAEGALEGFWIDMESKLRDDRDGFSIPLARAALNAIRAYERPDLYQSLRHNQLPKDAP